MKSLKYEKFELSRRRVLLGIKSKRIQLKPKRKKWIIKFPQISYRFAKNNKLENI
tara:strand:- start:559 stop:723 length:165 start_codon:yes stop_codon:yes gene_type:complete